ncbi:MAG: hypothetical protein AAGG53_17485 [Cyanobacteria bacterium P01_H01_bin.152]
MGSVEQVSNGPPKTFLAAAIAIFSSHQATFNIVASDRQSGEQDYAGRSSSPMST